jgi:hypothetical protein
MEKKMKIIKEINQILENQYGIVLEEKASTLTQGRGGIYQETHGIKYPDPNKRL